MPELDLTANRVAVFVSGVVYWAGVFIQARRIRRRIGHSPNVKPRGCKEKLLWAGWCLVVVGWLAIPFVVGTGHRVALFRIIPSLQGVPGFVAGMVMLVTGYAGTLWCYAAMGNAWRMGVNRTEKNQLVTGGPYRLIRHPIYMLQTVMLLGIVLLLPSPVSFLAVAVHLICALVKSADEEKFLRTVHGSHYADYVSRSGRFLPKLRLKSKP